MNPEDTQKLLEKHPDLFKNLCRGFECGDGWFGLISTLADKLSEWPEIRAEQVKEKFGGLRFYIDGGPEQAHRLIREAETLSMTICDVCGEVGASTKIPNYGWATRCEKHSKPLHSGGEHLG